MSVHVHYTNDDLFSLKVQALVHPVDLSGYLDDLSCQFRDRYPLAHDKYKESVNLGHLRKGQVHLVHLPGDLFYKYHEPEYIIHFPVSDLVSVTDGLRALSICVNMNRIYSIAMPTFGYCHPGDTLDMIKKMFIPNITKYLQHCYLVDYLWSQKYK